MSFYVLMLLGMFSLGGQLMGIVAQHPDAPFAIVAGGMVCGALALVLILAPGLTRGAIEPSEEEVVAVATDVEEMSLD